MCWAIWADIAPEWTGFGRYDEPEGVALAKTLWDWMDLLIVPAVLLLGGYLLTTSQRTAEREAKEERDSEQEVAGQERQNEQKIARRRQEQANLEAYFDK